MLTIVMHNREKYLKSLLSLMKKENVTRATIVEKDAVGSHLVGEKAGLISYEGRISPAYDKALVAVVEGEEKAKHLLDLIENDPNLRLLNLKDKGFICTVPFQQIKSLELD